MALFEVIRTVREGRDVCVKRLAIAPPEERACGIATTCTHSNETNIFTTREFGWVEHEAPPSDEHYRALLEAESRVIERSARDWNHPGAWLEDSDLVMPWCGGTTFSALHRDARRHWFPRMLPTLWRMLARCPHGDLKPDSFLIEGAGERIRILDPGVRVAGPAYARSPTKDLDFESTLATTNAEHYPLLSPQHGPGRQAQTARDLLQLLELGEDDALALDALLDDTAVRDGPTVADQVALGAMYFAILAGRPLATELEIERPLWCGSWSHRHRGSPGCASVHRAISAGVIDRALASAAAPAEAALCASLVRLHVHERKLATLVADVTRGT